MLLVLVKAYCCRSEDPMNVPNKALCPVLIIKIYLRIQASHLPSVN
uniref:Uncharacterized protein n=1 Tax=Anguilla anguilla TaxID=7936 RepID=A0A0E9U255_ANGAN